jgi:hypothetical protein
MHGYAVLEMWLVELNLYILFHLNELKFKQLHVGTGCGGAHL